MELEFLLYSLLFILIGLMLLSFFLVWQWFDAGERLKVVREITRDETVRAIRRSHNKCRVLLYTSLLLALNQKKQFWSCWHKIKKRTDKMLISGKLV